MKIRYTTALLLCLAILCTLFLWGCKSTSKATIRGATADEVSAVNTDSTHTTVTIQQDIQSVTHTQDATTVPEAVVSTTAAPTTVAPTKAPAKDNSSTQQKPQTYNNNNSNNSSNGTPVDTPQSKNDTCIVTIGGKDYTFKVGDCITYSYYVKTPKKVEDLQAVLRYTTTCLELLEDEPDTMIPVINEGAVINPDNPGSVIYVASNISGYDFTKEAVLITLRFKVTYAGSGSITNAIEIMSEIGGEYYVDNYKFHKDVTYRETLK